MDEQIGSVGADFSNSLVESSPYGIVAYDASGRCQVWNHALERLSGIAASERVGRLMSETPSALLDLDSRELVRHALAGEPTFLKGLRFHFTGEHENAARTGVMDLMLTPVRDVDGAVIGVLGSIDDITEGEKTKDDLLDTRAQLNQAMKMEAAGRLAGGVAHDFNNLLAVIQSFARFASEEIPADHPAQNDLAQVFLATTRAAALTRQLLIFSRKETVVPTAVNLDHAVAELDKLLRRTLGEDVKLGTHKFEGLWTIRADENQIQQILANLAINSRDAMPSGGELFIETANVVLDGAFCAEHPEAAPGRFVRLRVADTGSGIPPEIRSNVFEPFFTTKPRGKGTGLGLSTVHGIVKQAGGFIVLDSEMGKGTSFSIYFPAVEAAMLVRRAGTTASTGIEGKGRSVLVVEDDPSVREAVARMLSRHGYRVATAPDGRGALKTLEKEGPFDLLLTDVIMPDMSGKDLARRATATNSAMRVLYMSGYPDNFLSDSGFRARDVKLVRKPFSEEDLISGLEEAGAA